MSRADLSISQYGRAECPVCGGEFSLTKAGLLRHHDDKRSSTNLPFHPRCAGAGKAPSLATEPAEQATAPAEPAPQSSIADRRRRLEADAEDAKKALWNAQAYYDRLCNEIAALRREEMGN